MTAREKGEKYPWALMRRKRMPNFIPIGRWERGEKSGEPKAGGVYMITNISINGFRSN